MKYLMFLSRPISDVFLNKFVRLFIECEFVSSVELCTTYSW